MYSLREWNQKVVRRHAFWTFITMIIAGVTLAPIDRALYDSHRTAATIIGSFGGFLTAVGLTPWIGWCIYRLTCRTTRQPHP